MRTHTIAIILAYDQGRTVHIETLSDKDEIESLAEALDFGTQDPLNLIYEQRKVQEQLEVDFEDYVEALLTRPFLNLAIQSQGVQWFKSRIKIQEFKKSEEAAADVIAEHALKIYHKDPSQTDFFLMAKNSQVRVRVFLLPESKAS
jgi:hypothetical protein